MSSIIRIRDLAQSEYPTKSDVGQGVVSIEDPEYGVGLLRRVSDRSAEVEFPEAGRLWFPLMYLRVAPMTSPENVFDEQYDDPQYV